MEFIDSLEGECTATTIIQPLRYNQVGLELRGSPCDDKPLVFEHEKKLIKTLVCPIVLKISSLSNILGNLRA